MGNQEQDYDITAREETFKIGGIDHVMVEATGAAAIKYRSAILAGAEMSFNDKDGTRSVKRLSGVGQVESLLVSLCLFEIKEDKRVPVPQSRIEGWPDRVQKDLFARAKRLSPSLEEKDDKELKNLPSAGEGGSP